MRADTHDPSSGPFGTVGKLLGLVLFLVILALPTPAGLSPAAQRLGAVTVLMAVLWLTQAIPIAATSLIPLAAFPLLGIQSAADVSQSYINENIFLFLGGFVIALGIEKWGLHRRIALHIVRLVGTGVRKVVLGFMLATAFLSMWISNTASTLLMLPIGMAMLTSLRDLPDDEQAKLPTGSRKNSTDETAHARLSVVLMLAIAYSASVGGFTTLVGTPTNITFQQIWSSHFPAAPQLSAGGWMTAVLPLGMVVLFCCWGVLTFRLPAIPGAENLDRRFFSRRLQALGRPTQAEWLMLAIFLTTALLWILRKPLQFGSDPLLPGWGAWMQQQLLKMGANETLAAKAIHDSTVAIGIALLMFVLPARRNEEGQTEYLMDWPTAERLPWGVLLLIGGGFAIAKAFTTTGLSETLGSWFAAGVAGWPPWLLVGAVCLLLTFLTELTTNVATVSVFLPILAATALSDEVAIDPRLIMIPATLATSCAFMLPIATPPNAIVFGSGVVRMQQMVRYGIVLNLVCVVLITIATFVLIVPQLGISLETIPAWAEAIRPDRSAP